MAAKKTTPTPSAAKNSPKPAKPKTPTTKSEARRRREEALARYTVPPSVGRGRLTLAQVKKAVATALLGKVFEADV
jgi:hypothetical protein